MPRKSGGAQQLRIGDRVRINLNGCYRHYLDGLVGRVTCVLHHAVVVALDNDPSGQQRVVAPGGATGPSNPPPQQRTFQFHEVVRIDD
jgi:hypothetical protein